MKLIVGLGNPGQKYVGTRHNAGFMVLAELARRHGLATPKKNFQGETVDVDLKGERAILLWPHTFMNLSGGSVLAARDFYKLSDEELIVVCDDFNLPLGKLRLRGQGSAGGQKGLADTIRRLGSEKFARLRVGVGDLPSGRDPADFVLRKFAKHEIGEIEISVQRAADAVVDWANLGLAASMNRYN